METTKQFNGNVRTLSAATETQRAEYIIRIQDSFLANLNRAEAELVAGGMDVRKIAPFPHGNMSREQYRKDEARFKYFRKITTTDETKPRSLSMRDPDFVVLKPEVREEIKAQATRAANEDFDGYLGKLSAKIGAEIKTATLAGALWDGSILKVEISDGSTQYWSTRCIINQSVYGKLFNQWPTRLQKR